MKNGYTQRNIERKTFNLATNEVKPYRCAFVSANIDRKGLGISKSHHNILESSYYSQDKPVAKKEKILFTKKKKLKRSL